MKTNAARILDSLHIDYELRLYAIGGEHLDALAVADRIGLPAAQVFKTLVLRGDRAGVCLALVAGDAAVDLKALARISGDRHIDPVALKEITPLTGYVRGGVTALGCKREYPVYVDESMGLFDVVSVSAGARGTQLVLAPTAYMRATAAIFGAFARSSRD
jgi:Cys-tRNA(Pro)/Cys-tRNA(Cys) deacylase